MAEFDLMRRYPKTVRDALVEERAEVTEEERAVARRFGEEYFDGPRRLGLGGYSYDPKYFQPVVEDMIAHYGLTDDSAILDVGCAKGFMLHDLKAALPGCSVAGIDISTYCLERAIEDVKPFLQCASCDELPFEDDSFDLVVSIATIHNLDLAGVKKSLKEIMRVTRRHAFIKVNGHHNDAERIAFDKWNLVAKTSLHVDDWKRLFGEAGYTGDYSWFTP